MKNLLAASMFGLTALAMSGAALAQNAGGFTGPSVEIITVEQAKGLSDDTFVILRGNIQKKIGDEIYVFSDGTGTINIEIDDEDWNGLTVGPDEVVEIQGEIDKGWSSVEIDVDTVSKPQK